MLDLFVSLGISLVITVIVKVYFDESGLGAFPVLTFLVISVLSYMAMAMLHSIMGS